MIPGASREFYNVNPPTLQEQKSFPEIAKTEIRRKDTLEKQAVKN